MSQTQIDPLLKISEVKSLTTLSKTPIYALIADCRFPAPVKVGSRAVAWRASEIDDWISSLPMTEGRHDD